MKRPEHVINIRDPGNDLNKVITHIGSRCATLVVDNPIAVRSHTTVPENVLLRAGRCGLITVATRATLTLVGPIQAGYHKIFDGPGRIIWGGTQPWNKPQPLNQLWFGTDDDDLDRAVAALANGGVWYLPAGIYRQTKKVVLPEGVSMVGDGPDKTIILSDVDDDYAIEIPSQMIETDEGTTARRYSYDCRYDLKDFCLIAKGPGEFHNADSTLHADDHGAQSKGTGGIVMKGFGYKLENLLIQGFRSGPTVKPEAKPGNPDTQLKAGIEIQGGVDITLYHCTLRKNDIGLYVNQGDETQNTTSRARDCSFCHNRTHAIKLVNASQFIVDGAVLQGNLGKYTVHITDSNCTMLRDLWFEGNAYGYAPGTQPWKGSRDIYVEMTEEAEGAEAGRYRVYAYNVNTGEGVGADPPGTSDRGGAYPELPVELAGYQARTTFFNCNIGRGEESLGCVLIGSHCAQTLFVGCTLGAQLLDHGTQTRLISCDII